MILCPSMASAQGGTIFSCSHRVQDLFPTPMWCSHRSNDQIISILIFFYCLLFKFVYYQRFCNLFLGHIFISILGSLCMLKIISTILRKIFWSIKGKNNSSVSPSQAIVCTCPFTGFDQPFVHKSIFVLTFRKELPNLSFCKFLILFHNCYYRYC